MTRVRDPKWQCGWLVLGCTLALVAGCRHAPPPRPVVAEAPKPPPPPPPPTCDAIEEGCTAAADTRSPIQGSEWSVAPPPKWQYAHETDAILARNESAVVAITLHDTGDKKTESAKRHEALELLARKMGLTLPKKKLVWPAKPAKLLTVGDLKIALYQFDRITKDAKPGAMLVFTSKLPAGRSLAGAGFVLESDTNDSDQAILACVQSLRAEKAPLAAASPASSK